MRARFDHLFEHDPDLEETGELVVRADPLADAHGRTTPESAPSTGDTLHIVIDSVDCGLKRFPSAADR
ncbi:hypothetical protein K933_09677 [Candidatus Halobonum tyrrellensis G22]|uniref:Uncharacterized protein n=1 Tax=Candidatus Halobonum tyrrellensis G22 TaxID=1324957 RepID=V4HEA0_9EURY|nr:hypothetical protein K933_09677 [Candidatus Halobonum tyrrellensis G22]